MYEEMIKTLGIIMILILCVFLVALVIYRSINPETFKTAERLIREKAIEIYRQKNMDCWEKATKFSSYADLIGVENKIITCNINICQNVEPENIFYSKEHKEMGYYYHGEWFSEDACLRGHVINSYTIENQTYYLDTTISPEPSLIKNVYWICFRY